jgi:hypothetical protein
MSQTPHLSRESEGASAFGDDVHDILLHFVSLALCEDKDR